VALALAACSHAPSEPAAPVPAGPATQDVATNAPAGPAEQARLGTQPSPSPAPSAAPVTPASAVPSAAPAAGAAAPAPKELVPAAQPVPAWDPSQAAARMVAFASTRVQGNLGGFDVYLFDPATGTVYAIPAANTAGNEIHPKLSSSGRWMVFASNAKGSYDLVRYDLENQIMDPLTTLNTPDNELSPSIDDSGTVLAYLDAGAGATQIKIFDLKTGVGNVPAAIATMPAVPSTPQLSGDGHWLAFSATDAKGADVYLYKLGDGGLTTPPYINTDADEVDPWLSPDGNRIVFASNRRGSFDLFEADMATGFITDLTVPNSAGNERQPRYMGPLGQDVLFESDRTFYENRVMLYHRDIAKVDQLPITHESGEDAIMGTALVPPPALGAPVGATDFFGFGGLYRRAQPAPGPAAPPPPAPAGGPGAPPGPPYGPIFR
jgi:dipeptidyl aminopeptidase/acylaminoacyl peptidase